nr:MAG TPA_asm: hypothetical protein [Caudoviricetes sp.]
MVTVHSENTPDGGREKGVLREIQRGRSAARRLPEPHDRVRHGEAERLDVRKRHP